MIDLRTLLPLDEEAIVASVKKTTRCVTGTRCSHARRFRREPAAVVQQGAFDYLDAPIERVGAKFAPGRVRAGDGAGGWCCTPRTCSKPSSERRARS